MFVAKTLLLAGALGAAALAAPGRAGGPQTMHLWAKTTQTRLVDMPPAHASLGDEQLASGRLVDDFGNAAGTFGVGCTAVGVFRGRVLLRCDGWAALAGGQLTIAGRTRSDTGDSTFAVTGGTGLYRTARGDVQLHQVANRNTAVTVTLIDGQG
jgi:hypothetical protein